MADHAARDEILPELLEEFPLQFMACSALDTFTGATRPAVYPAGDLAGQIVFRKWSSASGRGERYHLGAPNAVLGREGRSLVVALAIG